MSNWNFKAGVLTGVVHLVCTFWSRFNLFSDTYKLPLSFWKWKMEGHFRLTALSISWKRSTRIPIWQCTQCWLGWSSSYPMIEGAAVWRNGIASDYEVREIPYQEIAGSTPVSVIFFSNLFFQIFIDYHCWLLLFLRRMELIVIYNSVGYQQFGKSPNGSTTTAIARQI